MQAECKLAGQNESNCCQQQCPTKVRVDISEDLMESLTLLCLPTPEANAIWTIRMIKGSDVEAITEADLVAFVKSVFRLAMLEKAKGKKTSDYTFHMIDRALQNVAIHRSHGTFKVYCRPLELSSFQKIIKELE
ncbi:unnamed protein product [Acanthocheilonema viteae]|uniref:Uncharacterized protein n=1 Tax=Acanthocheilonema viteae TaxID=6277 RepID=A0A498SP61_ACAVI|nr:unnamed protein product [Acanthocheilonema viteae]